MRAVAGRPSPCASGAPCMSSQRSRCSSRIATKSVGASTARTERLLFRRRGNQEPRNRQQLRTARYGLVFTGTGWSRQRAATPMGFSVRNKAPPAKVVRSSRTPRGLPWESHPSCRRGGGVAVRRQSPEPCLPSLTSLAGKIIFCDPPRRSYRFGLPLSPYAHSKRSTGPGVSRLAAA